MHRKNHLLFSAFLSSILLITNAHASLFGAKTPVDPPGRVARISYVNGDVSFSPVAAKNNVWVVARVNRPLVTGDRLWVDDNARAELQLGTAAVRIDDETSLRVINLNDQLAQFDLSQGSLILHVRQIKAGQVYEIDTPQLAFRVTQVGDYRVDVSDKGDYTIITVRKGEGFTYAKNAAYKVTSQHAYRFVGKNLQAQAVPMHSLDKFDRWSMDRENRVSKSRSVKYVSTTVIGYEDLDTYGTWRSTVEYGYVWAPTRVPVGWAPYRYGHWSWIYPWGWTWIDDQPWGFAPSHYGRWAYYRNTWVWIPGPRTAQSTYAPALVVFIGGGKNRIVVNSDPAIAWFPLGPRDVYVPPYTVSKTYFTNINVNNTTINQVQVSNVYNNQTVQTNYTNYQVSNAITAVPTTSFTQSQSTAKTAVPVTTTVVDSAPVTSSATVAPEQQSMTGTQVTTSKPSETTLERVPVVVTAPPTKDVPVEQVSAPAETSVPVVKTSTEGSHVEGTYNGGDSAKSAETPAGSNVQGTYNGGDTAKGTDTAVVDKGAVEKTQAEKAAEEAKAKADKEAGEKAQAEKVAEEAKAKADKEAAEKAAAEKLEADTKANAEAEAAKKAEADKKAAAEQEAADKAKAAQEAAAAKAEAERQAAEKADSEKAAAAAQAEAERRAAEKAEADKAAEAAKAEAERQAAEKAEAERAAAAAREDAQRQAAEKAEAEKAAAAAQAEAQRQAAEAEKAAAAQAEAQRQAAEAEKAAAAQAEAERQATEKAEAERAKAEAEKAAAAPQSLAPPAEQAPAQ